MHRTKNEKKISGECSHPPISAPQATPQCGSYTAQKQKLKQSSAATARDRSQFGENGENGDKGEIGEIGDRSTIVDLPPAV
jgi:hypothetical protein